MNNEEMTKVADLIQQAKQKYPMSAHYKGFLSDEEISELEKTCRLDILSLYMNGSGYYFIRYNPEVDN